MRWEWCQKYYPSGVRKITIFFSAESLVVVWREESREKITSVGKRLSPWWSSGARFTIVNEMPSVGKIEKLQRQRSARRDKSSGPLPFLFDVRYFCIFKIHFPSQIQLCVCLQDFARIWPDSGQTPWGMVWRSWFLLRFRAYLVESGLRSLFIIKIFRLDFSSRFCPDTRGFRSDPMRYGLGKLVFLSFSSLSRRIRTPESLEDFDDILHLQAFSFIFFFKISGRSS